jgi:hypothetical protein
MSIDSSVVPEIKITPPDGELLYVNPYIGEKAEIDEHGNLQIAHGYLRADWDGVYDRSYPSTYKAIPGWDGVHDSISGNGKLDYSDLVYKGSYPLYNVTGGILYVNQGPDDSDTIAIDIGDSTDTSTEPSDLKNTKSNIRKIKPDINSELKRV